MYTHKDAMHNGFYEIYNEKSCTGNQLSKGITMVVIVSFMVFIVVVTMVIRGIMGLMTTILKMIKLW